MKNEKFFIFKNKQTTIEFLKSIAVGLFSNAVDFIFTALIIYSFGHEHYPGFFDVFGGTVIDDYSPPVSVYITANTIGFIGAVILNYILSSKFVFKYGNVGKNKKGFIKFAVFSAIGLGITSLGSWIGYDLLNCNLWLTKLVIQFIVFLYNFVTRRLFIFNVDIIRDDENTIRL